MLFLIISCKSRRSPCDILSEGTFNLYEEGVYVGKLYRKGTFQVEEYPDKEHLTTGRLQSVGNCEFHLKSYYRKDALDTITWLVTHRAQSKDTFDIEVKAIFIDSLDYLYRAKIIKVSNTIPIGIDNFIEKL